MSEEDNTIEETEISGTDKEKAKSSGTVRGDPFIEI